MSQLITASALALLSLTLVASAKTISVAQLGLTTTGTQNATPIVRKALEQLKADGGGTLYFPKGTYHFKAEGALVTTDGPYVSNNQDDFPKWTAMPVIDMKNITIDGGGSLFLMHHRMIVFSIQRSENITLKNLAFDFVHPIHTDGTLTQRGKNTFTIQFAPGTEYKINDRGQFRFLIEGKQQADWSTYSFNGKTGRSKYKIAQGKFPRLSRLNAKEIKPGTVEFKGSPDARFVLGDRITFRHNNRNHVGVFIESSKNTTLDHVSIHHACAMGVLGQRSENITLDHFRMAPRAGTGRISTAMADATHFSGCKGLIKVTNSHFQGMMDDAINVHGTSLRITKIDRNNNSIIAQFKHGQSKGFTIAAPGDKIRLIDNETLLPIGESFFNVKSYKPIDVNHVEISFTTPLPKSLQPKHAIENITYTPEVLFSNNTIKDNRARGMLFNTPRKCVIENNFVLTAGSALLVAGDANGWFESGAVGEFGPTIIRNNTFEDCLTNVFQFCRAIISIDPVIKKFVPGKSYHRNIIIENNHFKTFDAPLIAASGVDGLTIKGNTFERTHTFEPAHKNKPAFLFDHCYHITLENNTVKGPLLNTTIQLKKTPISELHLGADSTFQLPTNRQ